MTELTVEPPKDYSWAEYLDCMEGGSDVLTLPPSKVAKPSPIPSFADFPRASGLTLILDGNRHLVE